MLANAFNANDVLAIVISVSLPKAIVRFALCDFDRFVIDALTMCLLPLCFFIRAARQIFGVLAHYDMTDLVAALPHGNVLVGGPTDSVHVPLSSAAASEVYRFAASVLGSRLSLTNDTGIKTVVDWLHNARR